VKERKKGKREDNLLHPSIPSKKEGEGRREKDFGFLTFLSRPKAEGARIRRNEGKGTGEKKKKGGEGKGHVLFLSTFYNDRKGRGERGEERGGEHSLILKPSSGSRARRENVI